MTAEQVAMIVCFFVAFLAMTVFECFNIIGCTVDGKASGAIAHTVLTILADLLIIQSTYICCL